MAEQPLILVLNGPNLNLLGARETAVYGDVSLAEIEQACKRAGQAAGLRIDFRQTNHEGELVDWIQEAGHGAAGLVLNAAAYSHSSIAVHDALRALSPPVIEVHVSNIYKREAFRHQSFVSSAASGVICGLGGHGYELAIAALARMLKQGA